MRFATFASLVLASIGLVSCGVDESSDAERRISVPGDYPTITAAVSSARPGTIIEIEPGTYHEAVEVRTERITIRGTDRNSVILDGKSDLANGISVVSNNVAIENLTVRNYLQNGIVFNGISAASKDTGVDPSVDYGTGNAILRGYRVSYVSTHNNGLYGIYAFASRDGLIEHSLASGHPDSGFYVGQCQPCDVTLVDNIAEQNAIGYFGTNASGGVVVARSVFRNNRLGIAPNSQETERLAPQTEAVIVGNLVVNNDSPEAPAISYGYFGGGIAVGGGTKNLIIRNRIQGHSRAGIELLRFEPYLPEFNRIEGNVLLDNAVDLAYHTESNDPAGNCFTENSFTISVPDDIEDVLSCTGASGAFDAVKPPTISAPPTVDYRTIAPPARQQSMPANQQRDAAGAGTFIALDISAIGVPQ
jgi:hypothetical protein